MVRAILVVRNAQWQVRNAEIGAYRFSCLRSYRGKASASATRRPVSSAAVKALVSLLLLQCGIRNRVPSKPSARPIPIRNQYYGIGIECGAEYSV